MLTRTLHNSPSLCTFIKQLNLCESATALACAQSGRCAAGMRLRQDLGRVTASV